MANPKNKLRLGGELSLYQVAHILPEHLGEADDGEVQLKPLETLSVSSQLTGPTLKKLEPPGLRN